MIHVADLRLIPEIASIVWRILRVAKGSINKATSLHNVCFTLMESGGLFTVTSILNLITILLHSPVDQITDGIVST
jgi:hypothetical protein